MVEVRTVIVPLERTSDRAGGCKKRVSMYEVSISWRTRGMWSLEEGFVKGDAGRGEKEDIGS